MREIPLVPGGVALIDDDDYERLVQHRWYRHPSPSTAYAKTFIQRDGERRSTSMHRLIISAAPGMEVDHIDRNGLNNQKENLRVVTPAQNHMNTPGRRTWRGKEPTSRYKGVHLSDGRWRAMIQVGRRMKHIGMFGDEIQAAMAYDEAAQRIYGEYAHLNFPKENPTPHR